MFLFITLLLAYMVIITHNAQKSGKGTHIISILCNFAYTFLPSTPYFFTLSHQILFFAMFFHNKSYNL